MTDWPELERRVDRVVCDSALSEPVIYTPVGGRAVVVRGVFAPSSFEADPDTGVVIMTQTPVLSLCAADLPTAPAQGDGVQARGVKSTVFKKAQVGADWVELQLHRVVAP